MKIFFMVSLFCFSISSVYAQQTLTWEKAVEITIQNNKDLQAAQLNIDSAVFQKKNFRGAFLPEVSGNLEYTYDKTTHNKLQTALITGEGTGSNYSASLTASQNLFSGLLDYGNLEQSRANIDVAKASARTTKANISYDLKTSFEGLLFANEYEKLTEQIIARREENLRMVQMRFQVGRENKGSVLLSQAYLEEEKFTQLQAQDDIRVSRASLSKALGFDEYSSYDIVGEVPSVEPGESIPDLQSEVYQTPDYNQAAANERVAHAGITIARSSFFPSLDAFGGVSQEGGDFFSNDSTVWSVSALLSYTFFSGGKTYYSNKSAMALWSASLSNLENTRLETSRKLEQAYATYIEAVAKLKVDTSFKEAATVRAEISRTRYDNGLLSFDDWDIIENDLITREKTYLQSKRDRVFAEAAWEQAQGKGVIP